MSNKIHIQIYLLILICLSTLVAGQYRDPLFELVESYLNTVMNKDADILCPDDYSLALEHYNLANELEERGAYLQEIKEELELSLFYLSKIEGDIDRNYQVFNSVLAIRKDALSIGADKNAESFWSIAEENFTYAVGQLNYGDINFARQSVASLKNDYTIAQKYASKADYLILDWEPLFNANIALANLLAPTAYAEAISNYYNVLDLISTGEEEGTIDLLIDDTSILFNNAASSANRYRVSHSSVLLERNNAKSEGADLYAIELWVIAENTLKESAELYEYADFESSIEMAAIAENEYLQAKHFAVKNKLLADAREHIELAEIAGAEEYAPKTLANSLSYFEQAEIKIDTDNYDSFEILGLAEKSTIEAKRARYIAEIIKKLESGDQSLEEFILAWNILPNFDKTRNVTPETPIPPSEMIADESSLEFFYAPGYFNDVFKLGEAEFYESDDEIIIRLIGLVHEPMSYELTPYDKILLDKTIAAIELYPDSPVIITSHTNNVLTKATNKTLSDNRAETINNYILQNSNIESSRISFIGYGEEFNIADNFTSEGRRKNQRIEIIIKSISN